MKNIIIAIFAALAVILLIVFYFAYRLSQTATLIVGSWQSVDDPALVQEFTAQGGHAIFYDDKLIQQTYYKLYYAQDVPKEALPDVQPGFVYYNLGASELWYRVVAVDDTYLEVIQASVDGTPTTIMRFVRTASPSTTLNGLLQSEIKRRLTAPATDRSAE